MANNKIETLYQNSPVSYITDRRFVHIIDISKFFLTLSSQKLLPFITIVHAIKPKIATQGRGL